MSNWTGTPRTDEELKARTRLIGLAMLTAAIGSDALFVTLEFGKAQVSIIVPALLFIVQEAGLALLQQQYVHHDSMFLSGA